MPMVIEIKVVDEKLQRTYILMNEQKKELCCFDHLSDASLVFRFLNGLAMTETMEMMAYSLLVDSEKKYL